MTKSLPLPPRFFQCPALSAREEQYLVAKAKESAKALVDATRNNEGPVRWAEAGMHRGVQMYKGEARHPESVVGDPITYGCGATTVQGTLDEVANFFDLSTHAKVRDFVLFNGDMMDCQLLYALQDPELLNQPKSSLDSHRSGQNAVMGAHQITVKWFVIEMPSKLIKNRDFLTLECQSTFVDVSGRRGWVRSYHSIKLPCCPDLQGEYGLVRGSFYHTGHVFIESERPGFLDVIFSAQVNLKGSLHLPSALFFVATKKRLSSVADLQKMLTRRRLGTQRFLGDLELVPKNQRKRCHLCSSKFGLLTRKARCRKCGEVVCAAACSTVWEVTVPRFGVKKVRVCAKCAQNTDPLALEDLPVSSHHSESASTNDDESTMSMRTPGGYHYGQYDPSESASSPSVRNVPTPQAPRIQSSGRDPTSRSLNDGAYYNGRTPPSNLNGYGRQQSAPAPQQHARNPRHYPGSEDAYSQHSGSYDQEEYPYAPSTQSAPTYRGNSNRNGERFVEDGGHQRYGDDLPSPQFDEYGDYRRPQQPQQQPQQQQARGDPRYDPRYREQQYDSGRYQAPPPPYRDQQQMRALQQQQRALQQQQQQQQMVQRQQQQQALLKRQQMQQQMQQQLQMQQQMQQLPQLRSKFERQRSGHGSAASSSSEHEDASSDAQPTALTSSLLAQHTRQMGRPGPVTRPARYAPRPTSPPEIVEEEPRGRGAPPPQAQTAAPPAYPPQLSRREQIQQQRREIQQAYYSDQSAAPPPAYSRQPQAAATAQPPPSYSQARTGGNGSNTSGKQLDPRYQRSGGSPHSSGFDSRSQGRSAGAAHDDGVSLLSKTPSIHSVSKTQTATTPGQQTLSITDDEDGDHFDDSSAAATAAAGGASPVTSALADNFSNLLRPEDLRSTVDSYRFSMESSVMDPTMSFDSINDYNALDDSGITSLANTAGKAGASAAKDRAKTSKTSIVQLYQQILALTNKQHALDSQPECDPQEKEDVARELQVLYQKLNAITQDPEVEL